MEQRMAFLEKICETKDDKSVLAYESANAEFKKCLPKFKVSLSWFCNQTINREQLKKQFGYLKEEPFIITEIRNPTDFVDVNQYPKCPLIDKPQIITDIDINTQSRDLCSISCLSDEHVWVGERNERTIKLFNFQGELVKSIPTKSKNMPRDITVTKSDDLVYTDYADHTVNIVKGENVDVQELIRLQQWRPVSVCSTRFGDLLLIMDSLDKKQTKVLRYSDYKENQSIQFNEKGQPLYSSGGNVKYIAENRNQDICVSDREANSVVVVSESGSLRFIYPQDGYSTTEQIFLPIRYHYRQPVSDSDSRL